MVRLLSSVFAALALSSAVLAVPTMPMNDPKPAMPEPAMATTSTSAAMAQETSTSTMMAHEAQTTTTMMHETTSTAMAHEAMTTSTSSSAPPPAATSSPMYGSGYSNWGTDLNSCVQMCQAKFGSGSPPAAAPPPPSATTPSGTGATHTVIVAPTKGLLRYVPFAVNATVGDTVRFVWGAGPHTVTKSSSLTVCNKSAEAGAFASGQQNASFVFDQVVNTTEPTFFYCAVPNHCAKGMFGIINPPSAPEGSQSSVGAMMSTWTSQNPDLAKMQLAVDKMTFNTSAYNWASNLDSSALPVEAHEELVKNIFTTRMFYASNPGAEDGASRPDSQPLTIPPDVTTLLTGTAGNPGGANGAPAGGVPSGTPTGTAAQQSSTPTGTANGAKGLAVSSALIAGVAVFSSFFLF